MSEIARAAGTTVANLYVYFDSKLLILSTGRCCYLTVSTLSMLRR